MSLLNLNCKGTFCLSMCFLNPYTTPAAMNVSLALPGKSMQTFSKHYLFIVRQHLSSGLDPYMLSRGPFAEPIPQHYHIESNSCLSSRLKIKVQVTEMIG